MVKKSLQCLDAQTFWVVLNSNRIKEFLNLPHDLRDNMCVIIINLFCRLFSYTAWSDESVKM